MEVGVESSCPMELRRQTELSQVMHIWQAVLKVRAGLWVTWKVKPVNSTRVPASRNRGNNSSLLLHEVMPLPDIAP